MILRTPTYLAMETWNDILGESFRYIFQDTHILATAQLLLGLTASEDFDESVFYRYIEPYYSSRFICQKFNFDSNAERVQSLLKLKSALRYKEQMIENKYLDLLAIQAKISVDDINNILYNHLLIKTGTITDDGTNAYSGTDTTTSNGNVSTVDTKETFESVTYTDNSQDKTTTNYITDTAYGRKQDIDNTKTYNTTEKGMTKLSLLDGYKELQSWYYDKNSHLFEKWVDELLSVILLKVYGL